MMKHTPGEWKAIPDNGYDWRVDGVDGGEIAICGAESGYSNWAVAANAQLIASAPDLLEACQSFMRVKIESSGVTHVEMGALDAAKLTDTIAVAIEKATGQE